MRYVEDRSEIELVDVLERPAQIIKKLACLVQNTEHGQSTK
jgi:hypothetical protein